MSRVQFFSWGEAAQAIVDNPDQTEVSLTGVEVGDEGARGLAKVFQNYHQIRCLFLNGSNIGAAGAVALGAALKHQSALENLQMTECRIGARGMQGLEPLMRKKHGLKSLILAGCDAGAEGAKSLAAVLRTNQSIAELVLAENGLGDLGVSTLAAALERNTCVHDLDLSRNGFGTVACAALARVFEKNNVLMQISLGENNFSKEGMDALRPGLQRSKCLQSINLERNNLGDEGAHILADAMQSNTTLLALYLGNNEIGSTGGEALANAVQKRNSLKHLSRLQKCNLLFTEVLLTGNDVPPEIINRIRNTGMPSQEHMRFLQTLLKGRRQLAGIPDIADRGISVRQFQQFADFVENSLTRHGIRDSNEDSPTYGQIITPENSTMYHVCDLFVKPLTALPHWHCSYAELAAGERQPPAWMISHWWGTCFALTAQMLQFHAACRYGAEHAEKAVYWCCTMANNQHDLSDLEGDILTSPFARVLIGNDCSGTVLLCDPVVTPMRRVWCVFEAHLTEQLRRRHVGSKDWHFLDVASPASGEVAAGAREDDDNKTPVALLQDALGGNWHEACSTEGARFPLEVARVGTCVQIADAEASVDRDHNVILNHVAGLLGSVDPPPSVHENYDQLNRFIHGVFASAELYRLAAQRPAGFLEDMAELIKLQADPNGFVRNGNTALFAAVGADSEGPRPEADPEGTARTVELLLQAGADPNAVNSSLQTVIDSGVEIPDRAKRLLQDQGAEPYDGRVAQKLEKEVNERLLHYVQQVFRRDENPFGARTMGDTGAKLLGTAERCLHAVAAILKLYPRVLCSITSGVSLHHTQGAKALSQRQAEARVLAVKNALQNSGCANPFECETRDGERLLQIRLIFSRPSQHIAAASDDHTMTAEMEGSGDPTLLEGNSSGSPGRHSVRSRRRANSATFMRNTRSASIQHGGQTPAFRRSTAELLHSASAVGSAANAARLLHSPDASNG